MILRRIFIASFILLLAAIGGTQYGLIKEYPQAENIGFVSPSPDQSNYATLLHYRERKLFQPEKEFLAIEIGQGRFDKTPTILHFKKIPVADLDLKSLAQQPGDQLIKWAPDSSTVLIRLGQAPIPFTIKN